MDLGSRLTVLGLAVAGLAAVGAAGLMVAGTSRAASPPPCAIEVSSAVAGQPLELSGPSSPTGDLVEIVARNERGFIREGNVRQVGGGWRGSITFRVTDAGPWTIDILDGIGSCRSPLAVVLGSGVTAPPADPAFVDDSLVPPPPAIDGDRLVADAAIGAVALVVGSWLLLAIVAGGAAAGLRPLAGVAQRRVTRAAAFIAVLGAVTGVALFVDFVVAMSHFGMGTPPAEQAVLNVAIGLSVIVGAVLGRAAALRIREPSFVGSVAR